MRDGYVEFACAKPSITRLFPPTQRKKIVIEVAFLQFRPKCFPLSLWVEFLYRHFRKWCFIKYSKSKICTVVCLKCGMWNDARHCVPLGWKDSEWRERWCCIMKIRETSEFSANPSGSNTKWHILQYFTYLTNKSLVYTLGISEEPLKK